MGNKILIVDDSSVSRMMIRGRIQGLQPSWEVLEAADGTAALALAQTHAPDFITMDVNMPGINGFEAVAQLRQQGCQAKIVLLTANIQESSREKARQLQVHFVQKPATLAAVQEAVNYFVAVQ